MACAREVRRLYPSLKVAVVLGDDLMDQLDGLLERGLALANIDTHEPMSTIRDQVLSANAYVGAFPIAQALGHRRKRDHHRKMRGCGACPCAYDPRIRMDTDGLDHLAAGSAAGHVIECGTQATGGNSHADWISTPDLLTSGIPSSKLNPMGLW